jgi:allophanate hydrolase
MRATLDGNPLVWNASHQMPAGGVLEIGGASKGVYGYVTFGGGIATDPVLGGQGAHLTAGLGRLLVAGDTLPLTTDMGEDTGLMLGPQSRWEGGTLRVLPSLQTHLYPQEDRDRFEASTLTRDTRGNRMGIRLMPEGEGFGLKVGQKILSEIITPGDIQIPGDGAPYILMAECQTTGGYPRIGTVIPADMPKVAQCPPGAKLRFRFVDRDEAMLAETGYRKHLAGLPRAAQPLVRDPANIADLLSYTLISGVTAGEELSCE